MGVLRSEKFRQLAQNVKPDSRKRITLPEYRPGVSYRVLANDEGQIVLDPVVTVPVAEAWVWQNTDVLASIKRGMEDVEEGRVVEVDPNEL